MKNEKNNPLKYGMKIAVFIVAIIVLGVSVSYAYFSINITGNSTVDNNTAATLEISTTLDSTSAINVSKLALIDAGTYETNGESVSFTVTNESTSNVNAYYTINLVNMSITKNLSSIYFKWALVITKADGSSNTYTGNFLDAENIASEGTSVDASAPETVTGLTKTLLTTNELLEVSDTDSITFYLWLENSETVDQLYLTNGSFSAQLSLDATPTKDTSD